MTPGVVYQLIYVLSIVARSVRDKQLPIPHPPNVEAGRAAASGSAQHTLVLPQHMAASLLPTKPDRQHHRPHSVFSSAEDNIFLPGYTSLVLVAAFGFICANRVSFTQPHQYFRYGRRTRIMAFLVRVHDMLRLVATACCGGRPRSSTCCVSLFFWSTKSPK